MIGRRRASAERVSLAWGTACITRRAITSVRWSEWPMSALTRVEKRKLESAMGHLDAAEEEVRQVQASLSKRSKRAGIENPDYKGARALN